MASKLRAVAPKAAEPSKAKILTFGRPNAGKTWTALEFPRCYYIDTEGGANLEHYLEKLEKSGGMYLGPKEGANDFSVVLEQIKALATEEHPYKTLVIDSVSHLFGTEVAHTQEELDNSGTKDEYGLSNRPATRKMRRIVNWLDKLDMNVVLIAHEKDEYGTVNGKREPIGVTFDCWLKLEYILHLALHIVKVRPKVHTARVRKTRLRGFPDGEAFPWSYEEFANRYGRDVIESEVKRFDVASADQLKELNALLERIKTPEGWVEKNLKAEQAETLEDMPAERIGTMIKQLKERMAA